MPTNFGCRYVMTVLCCGVLAGPAVAPAQNVAQIAVPLTDPGRQAVVSVSAFTGNVVIRGTNRRDVLVRHLQPRGTSGRRQTPTRPGMRRLMPPAAFRVEERNNEVTVDVPACRAGDASQLPPPAPNPFPMPSPGSAPPPLPPMLRADAAPCLAKYPDVDLEIEVPLRAGVRVSTMSGEVSIHDVDGRTEVNSVSGDVSLVNVAGSVVATSVSGDVVAVLIRADAGAPMAFTTLNGEVDVTLPAGIKANLKLRTLNGEMFTDFDMVPVASQSASGSRETNGRFRMEVERMIVSTLNGGGADIELRSFSGNVLLRKGK